MGGCWRRKTFRDPNLGLDTRLTDIDYSSRLMYDSDRAIIRAMDEIHQGSDSMDNSLDTLSAQMKSLGLAETTTNVQNNAGTIFRRLPKCPPITSFLSRRNTGHHACNGTSSVLPVELQRVALEREDLLKKQGELQSELDLKRKQLHQKEVENCRLKLRNEQFREVFLAEAGKQSIGDHDIVQCFVNVRQRALSLAKNKALCVSQAPVLKLNASRRLKDFYCNGAWECWKPRDRELHLREKIFEILFHSTLDTACFGVEGCRATLPEDLGRIAQGLSDLEAAAKKKEVSTAVLVNWRLATLECVEALGVQERWSEQVAEELWSFIAPIFSQQSPPLIDDLRFLVLDLCKAAFNLTIMMRKSRDEYRCDAIQNMVQRPRTDLEIWADAHAVDEGLDSEVGDNIAYVLFGALTKKSICDGGIGRVSIKAEVVMEKKELQ